MNTREIIEALRLLGTRKRKEMAGANFPTSMEIIGVTNPDLKTLMFELYSIMKGSEREEFMQLARDLIKCRIVECQMLAWLLLEKARIIEQIKPEELDKLQGVLDNWVSVDTYGIIVYGALWRKGLLSDDMVFALQESEDVWQRRLALVATVALNGKSRGGKGDAFRTLYICERAIDDRHQMIVKALSWALRSLIPWDRVAVSTFMEMHYERLHGRVRRELSHKLQYGTKN